MQAREAMEETAGESGHDPAVVSDAQYFLMGLPRLNFDRAIMRMEVRFFLFVRCVVVSPILWVGRWPGRSALFLFAPVRQRPPEHVFGGAFATAPSNNHPPHPHSFPPLPPQVRGDYMALEAMCSDAILEIEEHIFKVEGSGYVTWVSGAAKTWPASPRFFFASHPCLSAPLLCLQGPRWRLRRAAVARAPAGLAG